jgi:hypothetical protein
MLIVIGVVLVVIIVIAATRVTTAQIDPITPVLSTIMAAATPHPHRLAGAALLPCYRALKVTQILKIATGNQTKILLERLVNDLRYWRGSGAEGICGFRY